MSERYDFGDGLGYVPAHHHTNGGVVADSAKVHETARVGRYATVASFCEVGEFACIAGETNLPPHSRIGARAYICTKARPD